MSAGLIVCVVLAVFILLVALEVPIGVCLAGSGGLGIALYQGTGAMTNVFATVPFSASAKYSLFVIPMYVLLGALIANAGIAARIYRSVNRMVCWLPGGLAATAVVATAVFSGVSGSSAADVATFGKISVTEMSRYGYDKAYAAAVVAASGTFAVLIPPSIVLVVYGLIAQVNIGALLIAGVVPGIISALALVLFVVAKGFFTQRRDTAAADREIESLVLAGGSSAQSPPSTQVPTESGVASARSSGSEQKWHDTLGLLYLAVLFLVVMGGIYTGFFTATEAGAVGAFTAMLIAVLTYRSTGLSLRVVFTRSLRETADVTGMIFLLLIGGAVFTYFVAVTGLAASLTEYITELNIPPGVVVALILISMIPLGMFLDGLSTMLLVVPIAVPVVLALGYDGVWFGVLVVKMIEIGLLTPPVGINVFIISGLMKLPAESVYRRVAPFILLDLAVTALFFAFPDLVLWLPRMSGQL